MIGSLQKDIDLSTTNRENELFVSDENLFEDVGYTDGKVSQIIWYESAAKTVEIARKTYTYTAGRVTQLVSVIRHPKDNAVTKTITDTFTYVAGKFATKTRVIS